MPLNLIIEIMVAILLTVTIVYCYRLNKKLVALRADEESLMGTIAELVEATEGAERAVGSMRITAAETRAELSDHLDDAQELNINLSREVHAAQSLLARLGEASTAANERPLPSHSARLQAEQSAQRLEALRAMRKQAA
jgi:hypothetical protein